MGKTKYYTYNGKTMSTKKWCLHLGISRTCFDNRLKKYYPEFPDKVFSESNLKTGENLKLDREQYAEYCKYIR